MDTNELAMYLETLPLHGSVFVITGRNGSGKTRMLSALANDFLTRRTTTSSRTLICLAGTVQDKYPKKAKWQEGYGYFGRRINNNMFSEIAPYRELIPYLALDDDQEFARRAATANDLLHRIGLGDEVGLRFRSPRKVRGISNRYNPRSVANGEFDIVLRLGPADEIHEDRQRFFERFRDIRNGDLELAGVSFEMQGGHVDSIDLSSGERAYALCILVLCFCVADDCMILYDEPENSLHPGWQSSIMRDMREAIDSLSNRSRLFVATHSPMIVSGASNRSTYVLDLEQYRGEWIHSSFYGNSSDTILKQQFGMQSPRSMSFVTLVRDCLRSLITINSDPGTFIRLVDKMRDLDITLDSDDPLKETVSALIERRSAMQ